MLIETVEATEVKTIYVTWFLPFKEVASYHIFCQLCSFWGRGGGGYQDYYMLMKFDD